MSKTFRCVCSTAGLLLAGCFIMSSSLTHAALQTVPFDQSSDAFLKGWLRQDVAYLASDAEKAAYLNLTSDAERYEFIERGNSAIRLQGRPRTSFAINTTGG